MRDLQKYDFDQDLGLRAVQVGNDSADTSGGIIVGQDCNVVGIRVIRNRGVTHGAVAVVLLAAGGCATAIGGPSPATKTAEATETAPSTRTSGPLGLLLGVDFI